MQTPLSLGITVAFLITDVGLSNCANAELKIKTVKIKVKIFFIISVF